MIFSPHFCLEVDFLQQYQNNRAGISPSTSFCVTIMVILDAEDSFKVDEYSLRVIATQFRYLTFQNSKNNHFAFGAAFRLTLEEVENESSNVCARLGLAVLAELRFRRCKC